MCSDIRGQVASSEIENSLLLDGTPPVYLMINLVVTKMLSEKYIVIAYWEVWYGRLREYCIYLY